MIAIGVLCAGTGFAADEPVGPAIKAEARFETDKRPDEWSVNFGHWEPKNGRLIVRQLDTDMHAAASRWKLPLSDARIRLKVRLGDAQAFHVGFDPKSGALPKKGHLYSLILSPGRAVIRRHKDKADATSKDVDLATADFKAATDEWIEIQLSSIGDRVTASVGQHARLEATDPSFHVAKPAVVFRVVGGEVLIDDVEVTILKP